MRGDLTLDRDQLQLGANTLYLQGDLHRTWQGSLDDSSGCLSITGTENQAIGSFRANQLEVNKPSGQLIIQGSYVVEAVSFLWIAGEILVDDASFTALDLANPSIEGDWILDGGGSIDLWQDGSSSIDINADLLLNDGTFTIHGGAGQSQWATSNDAQVLLNGGILDFGGRGIDIVTTPYNLLFGMNSGEVRTTRNFYVSRPNVYPVFGSVVLYGSTTSTVEIHMASALSTLVIDKDDRNQRDPLAWLNGAIAIDNDLVVLDGNLLLSDAQVTVGGDFDMHGSLVMTNANNLLDVEGDITWHNGSTSNVTNGDIELEGDWTFNNGCTADLGAGNTLTFKGDDQSYIHSKAAGASVGSVVIDINAGSCVLSSSSTEPFHASGDIEVTAGDYFNIYGVHLQVDGTLDIADGASCNQYTGADMNVHTIHLAGDLSVDSGEALVTTTFLQEATGDLDIDSGQFTIDSPYSGAFMSFFGSTTIDNDGAFQITYDGIQFGAGANFNIIDGTVKVGLGLMAIHAGSFQQSSGAIEIIGTGAAEIQIAANNWFNDLIISKQYYSNSVYATSDLLIKGDLTINGGKLYANHHTIEIERDVDIEGGKLDGQYPDDNIMVGRHWTNNVGAGGFIEGTGLVTFYSDLDGTIYTDETFANVEVDKGGSRNNSLTLQYNAEVTVEGELRVSGGSELELGSDSQITTDDLLLYGLLDVNDGVLTCQDSLYTTLTSTFDISGGSFIYDAPWESAWLNLAASIEMDDGLFEITNRNLQLVNGATHNVSGGIISVGGNFYSSGVDLFQPTGGGMKFAGARSHSIYIANGSWFHDLVIDCDGDSVSQTTALTVKGDVLIEAGTFIPGPHDLFVHGDWTNNAGDAGFEEAGTLVTFTGDQPATITTDEVFNDINVGKAISAPDYLELAEGITCALSGYLDITHGAVGLNQNAILDVAGDIHIQETGGLMGSLSGDDGMIIYIEGNLYDYNSTLDLDHGYYPGNSTIVFDGTGDQYTSSDNTFQQFTYLTIDKASGNFYPESPVTCTATTNLLNGDWSPAPSRPYLTHTFYWDFNIGAGGAWLDDTGTVKLTGFSSSSFSCEGTANFGTFHIDKEPLRLPRVDGPTVFLSANSTLPSGITFHILNGVLDLDGYTLSSESDINVQGGARLIVDEGAALALGNGVDLSIESGGQLDVVGVLGAPATLTHTSGNYGVWVHAGGHIAAEYALFEYMGGSGIQVNMGATIEPAQCFGHCTFQQGAPGGVLLTVNTADVVVIEDAVFPTNTWGGGFNVRKNLGLGNLSFTGESGGFIGATYEDDMFNRINWTGDAPVIDISTAALVYGDVDVLSSSVQQFSIENTGTARLIGQITAPDGFSVGESSPRYAPGEPRPITDPITLRNTIDIDLLPSQLVVFDATFNPQYPGAYDDYIVIDHNAPGSPDQIHVTGQGLGPQITYTPESWMEELTPGSTQLCTLTVGNTGTTDLNLTADVFTSRQTRDIILESSFEGAFPPAGWIAEGPVDSTWAQTTWDASAGTHSAIAHSWSVEDRRLITPSFAVPSDGQLSYYIRANDLGYGGSFGVEISTNGVNWTFIDTLSQDSLSYSFQQRTVSLGVWADQNVQLAFRAYNNLWANGVMIDDVQVTGTTYPLDWLKIDGGAQVVTTITPGNSQDIELTFDATGLPENLYLGGIMLISNDMTDPNAYLDADLGVGYPGISVYPDSLGYMQVQVDSSVTQTVNIQNTGTISLECTITAPDGFSVVEGAGYPRAGRRAQHMDSSVSAGRNVLQDTLSGGETHTYGVTFAPTAAQDYNVNLIIENNAGPAENVLLTGQGIDEVDVSTLPLTAVGAQEATAWGEVTDTGNLPVTDRGVCWGTDPDPTPADTSMSVGAGGAGQFSCVLTGLDWSTTYHVRAYAINALGATYGDDVEFVTATPTLTVVTDSMAFGETLLSSNSTPQTFTIAGQFLVDDVFLTAPPEFEIEMAGSRRRSFADSLILSPTGGALAETTIRVRYSPTIGGAAHDTLTIVSVGSAGHDIALTGTGITFADITLDVVADITPYTALCTLTVQTDGWSPVTGSGVCWSISPSPTIADDHTDEGPQAGTFTSQMNGLDSGTDYYVRGWAQNSAGVGYSADTLFTTPLDPAITVSTDTLSAFSNTPVGAHSESKVFTVSAFDLTDDLLITAPSGFEVSPMSSGGGSAYGETMSLTPINGIVTETVVLIRFAPLAGGAYSGFCLATSAGATDGSVYVSGTGIVPAIVLTNPVTNITHESAEGGGAITDDGFELVSDCGICWSLTPDPTIVDDHTNEGPQVGSFVSVMDSLQADTLYYVRAWAQNTAGVSYGASETFTTLAPPSIDSPDSLTITIIGSDVQLTWQAVTSANSYHVYRAASPTPADWGAAIGSTAATFWLDAGVIDTGPWFYMVTADTAALREQD
ncbi:MAG: choice-of-anchor J domain-containing protein [Candidatus Cloacimonetes bacterium]|nr:choice-of-anchor J domain-containing protein [Candidatus Cloacimonadota bacterium]